MNRVNETPPRAAAAARLDEARVFLNAFADNAARDFAAAMMAGNYAEAILAHHPDAGRLDARKVEAGCGRLIETVFEAVSALRGEGEELFPLFVKYSRGSQNRSDIWSPEFLEAYQNYKHGHKLQNRYERLKPYLRGESYCDIGCGGGDLVYYLKQKHPAFKTAAGIDILDWRTDGIKDQIGFQQLDFTRLGTTSSVEYDTVTCLAVIHHAGNTPRQVGTFLRGMGTAVSPEGTVIVEEDVIVNAAEAAALGVTARFEELRSEQPLFRRFTGMDADTQRNVLILTDVLANALAVGVPEMPFPCGFQSLREWTAAFEQHGFAVSEVNIQGFVRGNFNQSSHVWFILGKKG